MTKRSVLDISRPVLVTMESFAHFTNANLCNDDGSIFEITLINCNQVSRNRTEYPLDDVLQSMRDRRVQERIDNKCFFGECEHPIADGEDPVPLKRLMRVEPSRWVWRIDNYWVAGDDIKANMLWAGPYGEQYRKEFINGTNFAASIRAYTPNYLEKSDANGKYVTKKHLMFIGAYDCVTTPGLGGARTMNPALYAELTRNDRINIRTKLIGNTQVCSTESLTEVRYTDPIGELRDMMRSEESANAVRDIFGIDLETANMIIRDKNTLSVRTAEGLALELPLSRTILSEVL